MPSEQFLEMVEMARATHDHLVAHVEEIVEQVGTGTLDQLQAAQHEAREAILDMYDNLEDTSSLNYGRLGDERHMWLAAGILSCAPCEHLERSPQPSVALLGKRVLLCRPCGAEYYGMLPDQTALDECDLCGDTGIAEFRGFIAQIGPIMLAASVCEVCAGVLELDLTVELEPEMFEDDT